MGITLITGNSKKAELFSKFIDMEIDHVDIDLDEIQSLDLKVIIEHKVKQAYSIIGGPVLVEDISLEFEALGRLPGPFIKFFLKELSAEEICDLLKDKSRKAVARCMVGYYDGENLEMFPGEMMGTITEIPALDNGFGWDRIFIPEGYAIARSLMSEEDYKKTYLKIRRLDLVKENLSNQKVKKM